MSYKDFEMGGNLLFLWSRKLVGVIGVLEYGGLGCGQGQIVDIRYFVERYLDFFFSLGEFEVGLRYVLSCIFKEFFSCCVKRGFQEDGSENRQYRGEVVFIWVFRSRF